MALSPSAKQNPRSLGDALRASSAQGAQILGERSNKENTPRPVSSAPPKWALFTAALAFAGNMLAPLVSKKLSEGNTTDPIALKNNSLPARPPQEALRLADIKWQKQNVLAVNEDGPEVRVLQCTNISGLPAEVSAAGSFAILQQHAKCNGYSVQYEGQRLEGEDLYVRLNANTTEGQRWLQSTAGDFGFFPVESKATGALFVNEFVHRPQDVSEKARNESLEGRIPQEFTRGERALLLGEKESLQTLGIQCLPLGMVPYGTSLTGIDACVHIRFDPAVARELIECMGRCGTQSYLLVPMEKTIAQTLRKQFPGSVQDPNFQIAIDAAATMTFSTFGYPANRIDDGQLICLPNLTAGSPIQNSASGTLQSIIPVPLTTQGPVAPLPETQATPLAPACISLSEFTKKYLGVPYKLYTPYECETSVDCVTFAWKYLHECYGLSPRVIYNQLGSGVFNTGHGMMTHIGEQKKVTLDHQNGSLTVNSGSLQAVSVGDICLLGNMDRKESIRFSATHLSVVTELLKDGNGLVTGFKIVHAGSKGVCEESVLDFLAKKETHKRQQLYENAQVWSLSAKKGKEIEARKGAKKTETFSLASLQNGIAHQWIAQLEGGFRLKGYTLPPKKFPNSGVTVSVGVDLGQWDQTHLVALGVPDALLGKIAPYELKRGVAAVQVLAKKPLTLNGEEALLLLEKVSKYNLDTFCKSFDRDSATPFKSLAPEFATVIASIVHHRGPVFPKRTDAGRWVELYTSFAKGDWLGAASILENFKGNPAFETRRKKEAQLIREGLKRLAKESSVFAKN